MLRSRLGETPKFDVVERVSVFGAAHFHDDPDRSGRVDVQSDVFPRGQRVKAGPCAAPSGLVVETVWIVARDHAEWSLEVLIATAPELVEVHARHPTAWHGERDGIPRRRSAVHDQETPPALAWGPNRVLSRADRCAGSVAVGAIVGDAVKIRLRVHAEDALHPLRNGRRRRCGRRKRQGGGGERGDGGGGGGGRPAPRGTCS